MKNIFKKLSCALLAAVMICTMVPLTANAATNTITYPKSQVVYMSSKTSDYNYGSISINNIPSKQSISKANINVVSGKSVISLSSFTSSTWKDSTASFIKGVKPYTYSDHYYRIGFNIKKTGTAKISFKVGTKTYTSTIKVLPYTNPIKSLTVSGVSGNVAGKLKTTSYASGIRVNKAQSNAWIKCTAANGWKITYMSFNNRKNNTQRSISTNNSTGTSSFSLHAGNLAAKQSGSIYLTLVNTKTKGMQSCSIDLY